MPALGHLLDSGNCWHQVVAHQTQPQQEHNPNEEGNRTTHPLLWLYLPPMNNTPTHSHKIRNMQTMNEQTNNDKSHREEDREPHTHCGGCVANKLQMCKETSNQESNPNAQIPMQP
ncbi:hypothetical protein BS47DRAFT_1367370 [Hydnum rufescens UP504]|uniref:Uncharacterized protein n=1 Tax=Hydnum rufescens UP504 TaxID=1448309 RepID=A0A9P6DQB7_9AGAM|nr:hypothetical protein BS47DRAFT_1367370 [Hydnum rufescens UP504]